jgi:choline kinase
MTGRVHTAVILAAGLGVRLGPAAGHLPKGFLRLGDRPIVEESIACLMRAGVERVVIGTGYGAERYEALAATFGGPVETVFNPHFAESGSMYTLARAAANVAGDFLLVESDLIYESRAVDALQAAAGSTLLVSGLTGAGDEVFVEASSDGRLVALSKTRATLGDPVIGELVGLTRVARHTHALMRARAQALFSASRRVDYESVLAYVSAQDPVHCLVIDDLIWTEIDDERHLERARRDVYPRLRRGE